MRGPMWWVAVAVAVAGLGCSAGAVEAGDSAQPTERASPEATAAPSIAAPERAPEVDPMRVLVTGFNDWKELGDPPKVWRCRDNPSCRLLLGAETHAEPEGFPGPLVTRLRRRAPEIEWSFATLPVTWGAFAEVPGEFEVIINVGLGVYDRFDALQLEAGAYNLQRGTDAAGAAREQAIAAGEAAVLEAPAGSSIGARLEGLAGRTLAGYEVLVAPARPDNSYLCNETHYRALTALHTGEGSLREVYFLHIPHAEGGDYEALAEGVATLILELTQGPV